MKHRTAAKVTKSSSKSVNDFVGARFFFCSVKSHVLLLLFINFFIFLGTK